MSLVCVYLPALADDGTSFKFSYYLVFYLNVCRTNFKFIPFI